MGLTCTKPAKGTRNKKKMFTRFGKIFRKKLTRNNIVAPMFPDAPQQNMPMHFREDDDSEYQMECRFFDNGEEQEMIDFDDAMAVADIIIREITPSSEMEAAGMIVRKVAYYPYSNTSLDAMKVADLIIQEFDQMKPGISDYVGHYVRAVYDFETNHPREINLKKGDIIKVTKCVDSNWLHGINRNVEGNFPSSFVEKILLPAVSHGHKVFAAVENFPAQQDGDLDFRKGVVIEGTEKIDDNWWRGKIGSQTGMFPTTHVMELEVPQSLQDRADSVHSSEPMFARALCDSVAQLDEELGFHAGDLVTVTEIIDDDWYYGQLGNKKGMFLSSCVELIQDTFSKSQNSQSENLTHQTISNSKTGNVLSRQTAVDQSVSSLHLETSLVTEYKEGYSSDYNANINSQTVNYSEFSAGLDDDVSEYNTQFSYTNENTRSLESSVSPYGMTLYPFVGESHNELSFNENEIVYLIQHVDSQWIEGQIDDKIGIFPSSFVSIVVDCPYAYDADTPILNEVEKNQVEFSTAHTETGVLESEMKSHISVTNDIKIDDKVTAAKELSTPEQYGLVLYDFVAEVDSDLSVYSGDTVLIVKNIDNNWVQVKNDHEQVGMVPKQFLDIVHECPELPYSDKKQQVLKDDSTKDYKSDKNVCYKNNSDYPLHNHFSKAIIKETTSEHISPSQSVVQEPKTDNIPTYTPCPKAGATKKPALPAKPKPVLAPKPILKPKPVISPKPVGKADEKSGPLKAIHSPVITKSLSFEDDPVIHKSSSIQCLNEVEHDLNKMSKSASSTDISSSSNGQKVESKEKSKQTIAAFSSIDSLVKSEMKKEIQKSEGVTGVHSLGSTFDFSEVNKMDFKEKKVTFKKDNHIATDSRKRHSVNFPLSNAATNPNVNKELNRQSFILPNVAEQPTVKVGHSTFFTDFSAEETKPLKVGPMRKPPPPPQKTDSVDFNRQPSLRKPPPPRPSVPKETSMSPPKPAENPEVASNTVKSRKGEKTKNLKDKQKIPRQHIKPTRPAPQRPAPGQMPRRPLPILPMKQSDNLMSFSPTDKDLPDDTNFEIIEDLKQRIKEVEADLEKYKKNKEELEFMQKQEDGKTTEIYDNIEFYAANIQGLTHELQTLRESLHKVLPSSELDAVAKQMEEEERKKEEEKQKEEDKKRAEQEKIKRRDKRERVIDELIQTERDYLHGLNLCIETFLDPTGEKHPDVDFDKVFGNIEDVADVSQRLLTLLENAVNGKDFEDQLLGPCFTELCDDMKNAYAPYCRNHDEVIAILSQYKDDKEDKKGIKKYFDGMLNKLREKIVVFDLEALLIKPVQRILKYPLLLNELIKSTEDSHKDKVELLNGMNAMTDVATAINEYKRRKDLVYKYKRETDQSLGDMLAKLNFHSLKKKGSRFKGRLTSNLGIAPQIKDEDFDREETRFREIERTVKVFTRDVQIYMDQLQDSYSCHEGVVVGLIDFYDEKVCPEVQKYQKLYDIILHQFLPEFSSTVKDVVVGPLSKLIVMFNGPNKVIEKRFDKLLDYDSMQSKEEKGSEKSLQAAKSNYEALNAQLLDELPKMYSLSLQLLKDCIRTFVGAQRQFFASVLNSMTEIIDIPLLLQSDSTIIDNFNIRHVSVIDKMSMLRIVPKGFNPKMEALGKPVVGKPADKKSKRMSLDTAALSMSPVTSTVQSDSQRVFVQQKYPPDKLYQVTTSYNATDLMDLTIAEGICVGIVMDKDPMGNKDRWFVDTGATKGFVPRTVLKLYNQRPKSPQNVYPSIDQTVLQPDVTSNMIGQKSPLSSPQILVTNTTTCQPNVTSNMIGQKSPLSSPKILITNTTTGQSSANQNEEEDDELDFALDEDMSPNISTEEFYYAAFGFEARNSNEINLFEGQVVTVLIKHDQENNDEWWYVDADGVKGYAPANYLKPMS